MTATDKTPACEHRMCHLCPGPGQVRRKGAPDWEAPLMTIRCECRCHHQAPARPRTP